MKKAERWGGGSSPRIRGKRRVSLFLRDVLGLIPAHTGKTMCRFFSSSNHRAHPRAYGENAVLERVGFLSSGSSPRIRGKQGLFAPATRYLGLIPAHTGKTVGFQVLPLSCWAHPRAYGENPSVTAESYHSAGSSPRIRGKRHGNSNAESVRGLIPAHTGKT